MNPFTQRERITDPERFAGRWREVGMVFERIEARRPVLLIGARGTGKSSLLTHVGQSAGAVLEDPTLEALYLDVALLPDAATLYRLIASALGGRGDSLEAVEMVLSRVGRTVLVCLDHTEAAIAAGWGAEMLEDMARLARRSIPGQPGSPVPRGEGVFDLLLVAAGGATAPGLSEPFAQVRLGAFAPAEVRLFAEAYLDATGVTFTSAELHEAAALSAGHPAYLQRAMFHLFEARGRPDYDWRAAYLAEAREQPVPGAPLPPEAFVGQGDAVRDEGRGGELATRQAPVLPAAPPGGDLSGLLNAALPLVLALIALQVLGNWFVALAVLVAGYGVVAALARRGS
ncbi:MAG: ATP-binding protein [Chloroflexaceae bacterium]